MIFSLTGELNGPECKAVIREAINIRKTPEPWFKNLPVSHVNEFTIILRVNGSLGSFGPEGVENIAFNNGSLECDLLIEDQDWESLNSKEIHRYLTNKITGTIESCLTQQKITVNINEIQSLLQSDN